MTKIFGFGVKSDVTVIFSSRAVEKIQKLNAGLKANLTEELIIEYLINVLSINMNQRAHSHNINNSMSDPQVYAIQYPQNLVFTVTVCRSLKTIVLDDVTEDNKTTTIFSKEVKDNQKVINKAKRWIFRLLLYLYYWLKD